MFQTRSFLKLVTLISFFIVTIDAALPPTSVNISILSENLRHILKWSSLQEACSSSVNYTVKYQGEYEYMQNDSWQDEHSCYEIIRTECDLTLTLSSDSDYNISVLARCDSSTLEINLPRTFNRRDTVLLAPNMNVTSTVGQIEVYFSERQNHININVQIWKEGDEQNVFSQEIKGQRFHHDVLHGGGMYCLKAEATLDITNKTTSTKPECINVQEPKPLWLILVTVGIAVALTLALALILGLITPRCSLCFRKFFCTKEALPNALLSLPNSIPRAPCEVLQELTHTVSLLDPSEERD